MTDGRLHVVIVGGGVIGISSAIALLDHPTSPCNVTLIATDLPSLDTSAYSPDAQHASPSSYASAWAGAHHVSDAKTSKQLKQDKVTFQVFQKLEKEMGFISTSSDSALVWVHQTEYWEKKEDFNPDALEWYPDVSPTSTLTRTFHSL
jgi:anaerobic glycerol-3-phosphate dehydrogenase